MSHHLSTYTWLFGLGPIGQEYAKILQSLNLPFTATGRSVKGGESFEAATGIKPHTGGALKFIEEAHEPPSHAIVAVTASELAKTAISLAESGVKNILLEKPGGMSLAELQAIQKVATQNHCRVYIAYNRRFFASTLKAQQIIKDDGGVTSFRFEFTEWPSRILSYEHAPGILENWFYHNSTHVVDLAFYLGGEPDDISAIQSGELSWHKPAIFAGSGRTSADIPFSYHADWTSAGRWWVEVMTAKRKLILCPMEQLKEQLINQVQISDIDIDNKADADFKPGFLKQVEAFYGDAEGLMNLEQQISHWQYYNVMTGRAV